MGQAEGFHDRWQLKRGGMHATQCTACLQAFRWACKWQRLQRNVGAGASHLSHYVDPKFSVLDSNHHKHRPQDMMKLRSPLELAVWHALVVEKGVANCLATVLGLKLVAADNRRDQQRCQNNASCAENECCGASQCWQTPSSCIIGLLAA